MGLLDNGFKLGTGLAIGLGAVILAPVLIPAVGAVLKPIAKAAIKGGIVLYQKGREIIAETAEAVEDLAAEAQAELAEEQAEVLVGGEGAAGGQPS